MKLGRRDVYMKFQPVFASNIGVERIIRARFESRRFLRRFYEIRTKRTIATGSGRSLVFRFN